MYKKEIFHFASTFFLSSWFLDFWKGDLSCSTYSGHIWEPSCCPTSVPLFPLKVNPLDGVSPTHTHNNTQKNRTKTNRTGNTSNERRRHQFFEKAFKKGPPEKRRASCLMSFYREDTCIIFILGLFFQGGLVFLCSRKTEKNLERCAEVIWKCQGEKKK